MIDPNLFAEDDLISSVEQTERKHRGDLAICTKNNLTFRCFHWTSETATQSNCLAQPLTSGDGDSTHRFAAYPNFSGAK